ncbi:MAG TPA: chromate transporter [Candidatus Stercoripulliclostridium merdipullorum]|uniref:Chromate transporter n=1 Tax=Candidatus Stercoripulliclostridium merdipullorum TaxID=2840952 RepID=A0A9D1SWN7_9FIRM|nr:chromate transporter [Candidatus Stercoripulliclostridium merdipullorum]
MPKRTIKETLVLILRLMLTFLKIGAFTFGGGYAMIALVEKDVVEKKKWLTEKEMIDLLAIAESTPGVIALNTATYVGQKVAGFFGALAASICVMLPSIVIIVLISGIIQQFGDNRYVRWAFLGIRAAVAALIFNAVLKMFKQVEKNVFSYILMAIALVLAALSVFNVIALDVVFILLGAAAVGLIYGIFRRGKQNHRTAADTPASSASPRQESSSPARSDEPQEKDQSSEKSEKNDSCDNQEETR